MDNSLSFLHQFGARCICDSAVCTSGNEVLESDERIRMINKDIDTVDSECSALNQLSANLQNEVAKIDQCIERLVKLLTISRNKTIEALRMLRSDKYKNLTKQHCMYATHNLEISFKINPLWNKLLNKGFVVADNRKIDINDMIENSLSRFRRITSIDCTKSILPEHIPYIRHIGAFKSTRNFYLIGFGFVYTLDEDGNRIKAYRHEDILGKFIHVLHPVDDVLWIHTEDYIWAQNNDRKLIIGGRLRSEYDGLSEHGMNVTISNGTTSNAVHISNKGVQSEIPGARLNNEVPYQPLENRTHWNIEVHNNRNDESYGVFYTKDNTIYIQHADDWFKNKQITTQKAYCRATFLHNDAIMMLCISNNTVCIDIIG
jgi:hypothetical protein